MERILIIKNFLGLVALTQSEKAALIRELVNEWHFSENEVVDVIRGNGASTGGLVSVPTVEVKPEGTFPNVEPTEQPETLSKVSGENAETPVIKKRGRKKKTETELPSEPQKRRRGRPKKVKDGDVSLSGDKTPGKEIFSGKLSTADAVLIEEAKHLKNISSLLDEKPEKCSKATRNRNPAFKYLADFPALKKFVIGQEYSFEFVYQWDGKILLSSFVLADLMPVGIYIPYKNFVLGKYRGFVVSIYDEKVTEDIACAKRQAAALPVLDDENWGVMDSLQWSVLKTYINTANRMLGKVGGDLLKRQYRTASPNSNMICGLGGFRYAVNVK